MSAPKLPPGARLIGSLSGKRSRSSIFSEARSAAVLTYRACAPIFTELLIRAAVPTKPIVRTRTDTIISISVNPRCRDRFTGLRGDSDVSIVGHLNRFLRHCAGEARVGQNHLHRIHDRCASDAAAGAECERNGLIDRDPG